MKARSIDLAKNSGFEKLQQFFEPLARVFSASGHNKTCFIMARSPIALLGRSIDPSEASSHNLGTSLFTILCFSIHLSIKYGYKKIFLHVSYLYCSLVSGSRIGRANSILLRLNYSDAIYSTLKIKNTEKKNTKTERQSNYTNFSLFFNCEPSIFRLETYFV